MKSKELIECLKEADPEGEMEVTVGNHDIYFLEKKPAYWDGRLQRIIIDPNKKPYYCIVGAKVLASGWKLQIHTMGVENVLENDPDAPVDLSDLEINMPTSFDDWKKRVEDYRATVKRINAEVDAEMKGKDNDRD